MSLLGRFLGTNRNKAYAEGVAHLEAGRFAEAVDSLRVAALGKADTPTGTLASFHFRQALMQEGRRLLRSEKPNQAVPLFQEAVRLWDQYPDLHCLLGAAQGLEGDWNLALREARDALRLNPDYTEARMLEAAALRNLERPREAAESLNALVESGRRVDHWLINSLEEIGTIDQDNLPADLEKLLSRALSGISEKEEVAGAVALCRAGRWEEGLEKFHALVKKRPRYPDYRTRLAAALFQLGRNEEALVEVEAALALNEGYRTAIDLKGLVLADSGRLHEARVFLNQADERISAGQENPPHEDLFGAYLRGVLALLEGDADLVPRILADWSDLVRNFARAELLLAAAADIQGHGATCARHLSGLAEEWTAEPIYYFLLANYHLKERRYQEVSSVLGRWPGSGSGASDLRPLYLEGLLGTRQGRVPKLPDLSNEDPDPPSPTKDRTVVARSAWRFLEARSLFLQGADAECWKICTELHAEGYATEELVRLQTLAAVGNPDAVTEGWDPPPVLADSLMPGLVHYFHKCGQASRAKEEVDRVRSVQPEMLMGAWMSADFWLDPVRNWIA